MRDHLIQNHTLPYPKDANSSQQKWDLAFLHNWRVEWRHLFKNTPERINLKTFLPFFGRLQAMIFSGKQLSFLPLKSFCPFTGKMVGFKLKVTWILKRKQVNPRTLFLDRSMSYRIRPDKSTYSRAFMIGTVPEDSDEAYGQGITGNGSGQGDIVIRFDENTPDQLFYFCPDQGGAGGPIVVKSFDDLDKPNQRQNLLITLSYGSPQRAFQILLKDILLTPIGPLFCERPEWIGEVPLPSGLNFPEF